MPLRIQLIPSAQTGGPCGRGRGFDLDALGGEDLPEKQAIRDVLLPVCLLRLPGSEGGGEGDASAVRSNGVGFWTGIGIADILPAAHEVHENIVRHPDHPVFLDFTWETFLHGLIRKRPQLLDDTRLVLRAGFDQQVYIRRRARIPGGTDGATADHNIVGGSLVQRASEADEIVQSRIASLLVGQEHGAVSLVHPQIRERNCARQGRKQRCGRSDSGRKFPRLGNCFRLPFCVCRGANFGIREQDLCDGFPLNLQSRAADSAHVHYRIAHTRTVDAIDRNFRSRSGDLAAAYHVD